MLHGAQVDMPREVKPYTDEANMVTKFKLDTAQDLIDKLLDIQYMNIKKEAYIISNKLFFSSFVKIGATKGSRNCNKCRSLTNKFCK